jgi:amino acid adenylation domain-containing protein/FkbM family methyltransferase
MSKEVKTQRTEKVIGPDLTRGPGLVVPPSRPKAAHQLFEELAARTPEKLAVVCQRRELNYGELNAQANQLAAILRSRGVGSNTLVAISLERSLEMVVGILGVLKAGGAYVPLDPAYPKERLELMIADSRPTIFLTQSHLVGHLPDPQAPTLLLDAIPCALSKGTNENPSPQFSAADLAYVIYTSGSTGKPKGVMLTQGNLSHYVQSIRRATGVRSSDVYLHTASISFSSSVRQLMLPLSVGASVIIATTDEVRDPVELFTRIKQLGVTVIDIVPSYWRSCVDALRTLTAAVRADLLENNLRLILSASEPLLSDIPRAWRFEFNHQAQLMNMLGQTETAGIVATYPIVPSNENRIGVVPLGRPINDTRIYLLDARLRPVPDGESGEICIGGPTVGLGYLNHPELTAERFPRDPFAEDSAARLFRTGDLGRLSIDGTLEFQGRIDNQVKIRGHRVEPAEIESALLEHRGVREATVIARGDQPDNSRLVAYVAPHRQAAPSIDGRERYRLPNNMAVVQQNKHETDFFYQQIFVDQTNFKHGISLSDGACVFDVGANIGFFSMFVQQVRQNVRVYAFEPVPAIFETLKANTSLYRDPQEDSVKLFQCGLAEANKDVGFTFYPNSTSQSGRYGDEIDERAVLRSIIANVKPERSEAVEHACQYLDALVESRVSGEKIVCRMRTLSEIVREEGVERIDLLKIDVEKSEADVLAGIAVDDWQKIQQIVIEAHDVNGQLARLTQLLREQGYQVITEQDEYLQGSNLYNVYATRAEAGGAFDDTSASYQVPVLDDTILSVSDLRRHLQKKLPDYFVPAEFVLLDSLPRLPNGKVDRRALQSLDRQQPASTKEPVPPLSPTEAQLAQIWSEVLKQDSVSSNDNFFDLGGDSILVMQIVSRAARAGLRLTPKLMFKHQTIAEVAAVLTVAAEVAIG